MSDSVSATEQEPVQVVLEVPDQEALVALLETVSDASVPVRTETVTPARLTDEASVRVNLDVLTEKQREALALALESGYYRRPRDTTLSGLAEQFDITKSAVSQRLRSAETKIVTNAMKRFR